MALQSSLAQLQTCIESRDWESATRHCARAMSLPFEVISGPFAGAVVVYFAELCPSTHSPAANCRKSLPSSTDAANRKRKPFIYFLEGVHSGFSFSRCRCDKSLLQIIPGHRLGGGGPGGLRIIRCRPSSSKGTYFRKKWVNYWQICPD